DQEINPITDIRATAEFRKHLSTVLVKRNLVSALKQIQD
ncbi:MAG TPA: xanthine dehydrogenase family protein subunit M, partial [Clostridiales bacterium]|nr:xanthine dehydrogenase family protein subunit M [Clostridiales bacterium]